jgi:hypothetical protein
VPVGDDLDGLIRLLDGGDRAAVEQSVAAAPEVVHQRVARADERFLAGISLQLYAGDTALHVAAAAYDAVLARLLLDRGADVRARNRRGAEPLHAAVTGAPGSHHWDPPRQCAMIACLLDAGADPEATAAGGVTPLHRAVRNRCSAAVAALLRAGADPLRPNASGSTAVDLASLTTGRPGSGSPEARAEQRIIAELLAGAPHGPAPGPGDGADGVRH